MNILSLLSSKLIYVCIYYMQNKTSIYLSVYLIIIIIIIIINIININIIIIIIIIRHIIIIKKELYRAR